MKNYIITTTAIVLCFANISLAQRILSVKELKEDSELIKKSLIQFHSGLYRYNSQEDFETKFKDFESKINEPLSEGDYYKLVSQLLSEIRCSHTHLNPYNQREDVIGNLFNKQVYFPFYFEIIDYNLVITENASNQVLPRGSIISKINGVPSKEIIMNLLSSTSSDGMGTIEHRIKSLEISRFSGSKFAIFDMMYPLYYPLEDSLFKIEAVNFLTKEKLQFEVSALTKSERTKKMEERYGKTATYDDGWKFEIWPDGTAYIKIEHFITWQLSFKMDIFFKNAFTEMSEKQVQNLVIDIRNSNGGDSKVYLELFKYMFDGEVPCKFPKKSLIRNVEAKPDLAKYIQTYDETTKFVIENGVPSNLYTLSEDKTFVLIDDNNCSPNNSYKERFTGNIYLLVNSANTSASFAFAYYAQQYKLATLVGQETGGNLLGFNGGSFLFFYLPNSKFEFDIPTQAFYLLNTSTDSGVVPDYLVDRNPDDIGNGIDKEVQVVKKLIEQ